MVLLPVHVRRKIGQHPVARLAFAQRAQIARIERSEPHQAPQAFLRELLLVQEFECAFGDRALAQRGLVFARDDNEWRIAGAREGTDRGKTARIRQVEIDEREIKCLALRAAHCFLQRSRDRDRRRGLVALQVGRRELRRNRFVFDQENADRGRRRTRRHCVGQLIVRLPHVALPSRACAPSIASGEGTCRAMLTKVSEP